MFARIVRRLSLPVVSIAVVRMLAACGGDSYASFPVATGVPPTIVQQPADLSVTAGQPASFSVAASGTAPLAYQWQRGGSAIAGATAATYTLTGTSSADSGAVFKVVVSNGAGSATSANATLTVMAAPPVLTVTQQPAASSVAAGAMASFTVAATCSSGTLDIQWQRASGTSAFANIAGATSATYAFTSTSADSGAQFRAALDCSGQSATTSNAATLTVSSPSTTTSTAHPLLALTGQANVYAAYGIAQEASGSFVFGVSTGIKRLSADLGTITTVAGDPTGVGSTDGPAPSARFNNVTGVTLDAAGNIVASDGANGTIRRIAAVDGTVSTIAGLADSSGFADGTGSAARFYAPNGLAFGPDGDLYVADTGNHRIRRVTAAGVVTTYAGGAQGYVDGSAATAQFYLPNGIAIAANGDLYVSDYGNNLIRRIVRAGNAAGAVETFAGSGSSVVPSVDGTGVAAGIVGPTALSLQGNTLSVLDGEGLLRQIDITTRAVTTLTGSRALQAGYADGALSTARLSGGGRLTPVASGGFMITDTNAIRSISATGVVRTIATSNAYGVTTAGTGVLAHMPLALFTNSGDAAVSLAADSAGNLIIGENAAQDVRRIDPSGVVSLVAGLAGSHGGGSVDGVGSEAQFQNVGPVAVAPSGVVYVGDRACVRRIGTDRTTTTLAGSCTTFTGAVDGNATTARFGGISGLAVGPNGDLFVADPVNKAIRRIDAAGNVSTYAGAFGQAGTNDGPIATARLQDPRSVAFAPDGALIVADYGSLRRIAPDGSSLTTLMPTPNSFASAGYIAVDSDGTIYFGGSASNLVAEGLYKLVPGASAGTVVLPYSQYGPVLGSGAAANVGFIDALTLVGPKQLAVLSAGQLIKVVLP